MGLRTDRMMRWQGAQAVTDLRVIALHFSDASSATHPLRARGGHAYRYRCSVGGHEALGSEDVACAAYVQQTLYFMSAIQSSLASCSCSFRCKDTSTADAAKCSLSYSARAADAGAQSHTWKALDLHASAHAFGATGRPSGHCTGIEALHLLHV